MKRRRGLLLKLGIIGAGLVFAACSDGVTDSLTAQGSAEGQTSATTDPDSGSTAGEASAGDTSDTSPTVQSGEASASGSQQPVTDGDHDADTIRYVGPIEMALSVDGNTMKDATGSAVRLRGVNFSGTEYACSQGWGIFDGFANQNTVDQWQSWGANAVRIQLHEHCWLARNGAPAEFSGEIYRNEILRFVDLLGRNDMYVVVGLSRGGPGIELSQGVEGLPNRDNSIDFWHSVAQVMGDRPNVIFGLYGEPHDVDWDCWLNGCDMGGWFAAGMQELLDTVRAAGAQQIVMIGGIAYANDITRWLELQPHDPTGNLVADAHIYSFNVCSNRACRDAGVGAVAQEVPVILAETGENDCSGDFTLELLRWADELDISYFVWTWNAWGVCPDDPNELVDNLYVGTDLLSNVDGTPNAFGTKIRDHMVATAG